MRDLIFISMEDWNEQWRRNQFVCAQLARRHPDKKILFLGVPRNCWRYLARLDVGTLIRSPVKQVAEFPNITVTRALRIGLERFQWGVRLNEAITRRHVSRLASEMGLRDPILWLNPHWAVHLVGKLNESAVVYDITDDWISRDQPSWLAEQVRRQDAELCKKADAVIVCSQRLFEMKQSMATGKLHLIPNGVDADHYRAAPSDVPPVAAQWQKPVFGYTGTLHADRLDLELIHAVAGMLKQGTMVFIGDNHLSFAQQRRLTDTGRVVFHDPVPYAVIPRYMQGFDVCMTPHRTSAFVQSLQPIKLWEYLAIGKPIVATDIAGFRDYPQLVRIARGPEDFCRQMYMAASEGDGLVDRRQSIARENSWVARVDEVERVLEEIAPLRPQALRA